MPESLKFLLIAMGLPATASDAQAMQFAQTLSGKNRQKYQFAQARNIQFQGPEHAQQYVDYKNPIRMSVEGDEMRIYVSGVIGIPDIESEMPETVEVLQAIGEFKGNKITEYLNSPGGNMFDGMAIYNALLSSNATIEANVVSLAGSAATLPMVAADRVIMPETSRVFIHLPLTITYGNRLKHARSIATLQQAEETVLAAYLGKARGVKRKDLIDMLEKETYLTAAQAVELGFADEIVMIDKRIAAYMEPVNMAGAENFEHLRKFATTTTGASAMNERLLHLLLALGLPATQADQAGTFHQNLEGPQRMLADQVAADPEAAAYGDVQGASLDSLASAVDMVTRTYTENYTSTRTVTEGVEDESGNVVAAPDVMVQQAQALGQPVSPSAPAAPAANLNALPAANAQQATAAADTLVERQRVQAIMAISEGVPSSVVDQSIASGEDRNAAAMRFLNHVRGTGQAQSRSIQLPDGSMPNGQGVQMNVPNINVGTQYPGISAVDRMTAALSMTALGVQDHRCLNAGRLVGAQATQMQEVLAQESQRFGYVGYHKLFRMLLEHRGQRVPNNDEQLVRMAMSTGDLSQIFTDSVNAAISQAFANNPYDIRFVTEDANVKNFKDQKDILMDPTENLTLHTRGGAADHFAPSDQAETWNVNRFSRQGNIDEMDMIDDDMGALQAWITNINDQVVRLVPDLVYAVMIANANMSDGTPVFDASRGNLGTSGTAFAQSTLKVGIKSLENMAINGILIGNKAHYLVTPSDLKFDARQTTQSAELAHTGGAEGVRNTIRDENIEPVSSARLSVGVTHPVTGVAQSGSSTAWYLLGHRTIKVGYRSGTNRRPQVETTVLTQGQWGINVKVKFDVGAHWMAGGQFRAYKATGAA